MNADEGGDTADDGDSGEFPAPCPDPETVGDLLTRDRRTSGPALRVDASGRTYSYRDFVTTTYKAGNVLRYLGVREGETVLVVPDALPEPVLTFFGAAQLGAVTRFSDTVDDSDPPRAVVAPADREAEFNLPPGHHLAVYGDRPSDPATTHWETEVWSENPAIHPASVDGGDTLIAAGDRRYTHAEALSAAASVISDAELRSGNEMAVRGSLADPDVVVAGLLAPIAAGATVVFPDECDSKS
ncbi:AMP-binding protein [Halobellus sp. GM3]|uniref:AMP-binding protein n=1 Tax=Halobellus sp. GM3 TaxID=3458410 RepID=UPI00403E2C6A